VSSAGELVRKERQRQGLNRELLALRAVVNDSDLVALETDEARAKPAVEHDVTRALGIRLLRESDGSLSVERLDAHYCREGRNWQIGIGAGNDV
jgi:ribosome-binding protein aMBF1 (putative translation factor)